MQDIDRKSYPIKRKMLEVKTLSMYEARFITYCNSWPTFRNILFRSAHSENDIVSKDCQYKDYQTVQLISYEDTLIFDNTV